MHDTIDEQTIRSFVSQFYAAIRRDPDLGPIFARNVDDWAEHEERLTDFWCTVLLAQGRYKGNPLRAHAALPELKAEHFPIWLELFEGVAREVFDEDQAKVVVGRAHRMADHLVSRLAAA